MQNLTTSAAFRLRSVLAVPLLAIAALVMASCKLPTTPAATETPTWIGVWTGTIGTSPVRVCLQDNEDRQFGAYYHMRDLVPVHLAPISADRKFFGKTYGRTDIDFVWSEFSLTQDINFDKAPFWRFSSITADHLRGEWSGEGKTLPVDLTRVPMVKAAYDYNKSPCGNLAFNQPRHTQPVVTTEPAELNGVAYTRVHFDIGKHFDNSDIESFQLQGTAPAIQRVNAALNNVIPDDQTSFDYFQCSMQSLDNQGFDGFRSVTWAPVILSGNWLVVEKQVKQHCTVREMDGGATYETWDLRTGSVVNLYDWFNTSALTQTVNNKGTPEQVVSIVYTKPFLKILIDAYSAQTPCDGAITGEDSLLPYLSPEGMSFTLRQGPCYMQATIPFAKLTPYLSPAGQAGVAAFTGEVKPGK